MEFILTAPIEKLLPSKIGFNFEEMKTQLTADTEFYNNLVITEGSIKDAEKKRAEINALKKSLDAERIRCKKAYLVPYDEFEKEIKEILSIIDKPIIAMDTQLKAFEKQKQDEKWIEISAFYGANIKELAGLVLLEKIVNPKWKNVGEKLSSITEDMAKTITKIRNDLGIISAFKSEYGVQLKDTYLKNFDMSAALAEKSRLEEQAKKLEEVQKIQEQAKLSQEQAQRPQQSVNVQPINSPVPVQTAVSEPVSTAEIKKNIDVRFYNTTQAFRDEMKALTTKHNIMYGGISNGK